MQNCQLGIALPGVFFYYLAMPRITLAAPAKLNLSLHITGKRPDGFHNIESLFLALAFGDTLIFETARSPSLAISMVWQPGSFMQGGGPRLRQEDNIITRAVSLFRDRAGYETGLKITVKKRIPEGGGLGGGSSNAAAALLALNRLANPASGSAKGLFSAEELAEMGAALGSDVPFFLRGAPAAWVCGRGEDVRPFALPEAVSGLTFLLVNPGFSSKTAEAYRLFQERRQDGCVPGQAAEAQIKALSAPPKTWDLRNDFLPVFAARSETGAAYQEIISSLYALGADFAGLSGSGSSCFGVFSGRNTARSAKKSLLKHFFFVIETFPLARRSIPYYNGR